MKLETLADKERSGTLRSDTPHSGTLYSGTLRSDTPRSGTLRSDIPRSGTMLWDYALGLCSDTPRELPCRSSSRMFLPASVSFPGQGDPDQGDRCIQLLQVRQPRPGLIANILLTIQPNHLLIVVTRRSGIPRPL